MKVTVLASLNEDMVLWRYMSLDKFINLLDDEGIFFAPLKYYQQSDPFEGYPPAVALRAIYSLSEAAYKAAADALRMAESRERPWSQEAEAAVERARKGIAARPAKFRLLAEALFKGTLVSCWYYSAHQSEAMWKLYTDQGKGIAIRTTVGKLRKGLEAAESNPRQTTIFIGKVKYVDYSDPTLAAHDCSIDGHVSPLLKRTSYSHENEVRAFLAPDLDTSNMDSFEIKPYMASCDVRSMIDAVYVSPYANAPFLNAVTAIVKNFGLTSPVHKSDLLSGADELFKLD